MTRASAGEESFSKLMRGFETQKRKSSVGHGDIRARMRYSINDDDNEGEQHLHEHEDVFHLKQLLAEREAGGDRTKYAIQAYEETLVDDEDMAKRMELSISSSTPSGPGFLIPWRGKDAEGRDTEILTDRYDALHLLSCLPPNPSSTAARASPAIAEEEEKQSNSPYAFADEGWSDLDSDTEDIFFMTASQAETHYAQKKQRRLAALREQRIAGIEAQESAEEQLSKTLEEEAARDKSREKISQAQMDLMVRTVKAMRAAGNSKVLEMKILANHGSDGRFAFLSSRTKGPIKEVWHKLLRGVDVEEAARQAAAEQEREERSVVATGIGQLADYGSDSEEEEEDTKDTQETNTSAEEEISETIDDTSKREARLQRAREWTRRRREEEMAKAQNGTADG